MIFEPLSWLKLAPSWLKLAKLWVCAHACVHYIQPWLAQGFDLVIQCHLDLACCFGVQSNQSNQQLHSHFDSRLKPFWCRSNTYSVDMYDDGVIQYLKLCVFQWISWKQTTISRWQSSLSVHALLCIGLLDCLCLGIMMYRKGTAGAHLNSSTVSHFKYSRYVFRLNLNS